MARIKGRENWVGHGGVEGLGDRLRDGCYTTLTLTHVLDVTYEFICSCGFTPCEPRTRLKGAASVMRDPAAVSAHDSQRMSQSESDHALPSRSSHPRVAHAQHPAALIPCRHSRCRYIAIILGVSSAFEITVDKYGAENPIDPNAYE